MRLQLYRRDTSLPESISGVGVNEKYIATVRSNGIIEIFSNPNLFKITTFDIGIRDVQSAEFNGDTLIITSLSEGIAYLDLNTFSVKRDRRAGPWKVYCSEGRKMVIYSLVEGGSELYVNDLFVYRSIGYIIAACFGREKGEYLLGTATCRFLHIKDGKVLLDKPLDNKNRAGAITEIVHVVGAEYAVSTIEGDLYIVDVDERALKQAVAVRNSSINGLCTIGERIFMAGADSRIVCYGKTARYYAKESQNDVHVADVLFIKESNGNIVSVSDDGSINVTNIPKVEKMFSIKRHQDRPCSYADGKIYAGTNQEIDIYSVCPDKNETKRIFKHITKSPVLDINSAQDITTIRTKEGLRVYKYDWTKQTVEIKKQIKGLVLYHTIIDACIWYISERQRGLVLSAAYNNKLEKREQEWRLNEIGVDFIPSSISKGKENTIIIAGRDVVIFNVLQNSYTKITDETADYFFAAQDADRIYCIGQSKSTTLKKSVILSVYSLDGNKIKDEELSGKSPIAEMKVLDKTLFLIQQEQIKILDERERKLIVHAVIDRVDISKEGIVAVQRPWAFIKQKLPRQVFKEKYGRK